MEAARLMACGDLHGEEDAAADLAEVDEALAAFGLVADWSARGAPLVDTFCLWPENLPALNLFNDVQTQWKVGPLGPTGLDYPGVRASPAFNRIAPSEREQVFEGACVMERAYLAALTKRVRAN